MMRFFRFSAPVVLFSLSAAQAADKFPPLPIPVSSFGAVTTDGYAYLYGGHKAKTHQYSTDSVTGQFIRLKISEPTAWETLPGGPALQGLAVVEHDGLIYRIGGMQPRNKPGEKADTHSVATSIASIRKPRSGRRCPTCRKGARRTTPSRRRQALRRRRLDDERRREGVQLAEKRSGDGRFEAASQVGSSSAIVCS